MDQALRIFTAGSAWLAFEEDLAGSLKVGKRADFTVFQEDPRRLKPEEVPDLPVTMTVVGGDPVHVV